MEACRHVWKWIKRIGSFSYYECAKCGECESFNDALDNPWGYDSNR